MLGYHDAFFACFLLFLIPMAFALFIDDRKASAAMMKPIPPPVERRRSLPPSHRADEAQISTDEKRGVWSPLFC